MRRRDLSATEQSWSLTAGAVPDASVSHSGAKAVDMTSQTVIETAISSAESRDSSHVATMTSNLDARWRPRVRQMVRLVRITNRWQSLQSSGTALQASKRLAALRLPTARPPLWRLPRLSSIRRLFRSYRCIDFLSRTRNRALAICDSVPCAGVTAALRLQRLRVRLLLLSLTDAC